MTSDSFIHIPQELQNQRRWLLWRQEQGRKVPYYASTHRRRNGAMDTPDDLAHLVGYDEAVRAMQSRDNGAAYAGLGFAITSGQVLIDLDDVLQEGVIADEWARTFVEKAINAGAFVEVSQSGKGIHIIGNGTATKCGHKDVSIEIYSEKRFVAITGNAYSHARPEVLTDCSTLAEEAHQEYQQRVRQRRTTQTDVRNEQLQMIRPERQASMKLQLANMLQAFDADDREQWVKIGLALGRAFPENQDVFDAYTAWSESSDKYDGEKDDHAMKDIFFRQSQQPAATKYTIDTMLEELCSVWSLGGFKSVLPALFVDDFDELAPIDHHTARRVIVFSWDTHSLTEHELEHRPPQKRFIIDRILPAARTAMIGRGGLGKTMLLLYEALHVAIGSQLYAQHDILDPGRVLIVTAEEERALLVRRAASLLDRLNWDAAKKKQAFTSIAIQDVSSRVPRLIGQNKSGEFHVTPWTEKLIDGYASAGIKWVIFDPISAFGMNENAMNDSAVVIMEAATRMSDGLGGAAVTLVHHTSKDAARNNIVDAHSGRGGSAFGDASRATRVLTSRIGLPNGVQAYDPMTRTSRLTLHHVKNSYAAPVEPLNIDVVDGYEIKLAEPQDRDEDAEFWSRAEQVIEQEEMLTGHAPSIETLTRSGNFGVSRQIARQRLMDGVAVGRLILTEHPTDKRKRGVRIVKDWGGF